MQAPVSPVATATASLDVYTQAPLVAERREIRILSLAPGAGDEVLRGDLIVESVNDDDLHYIALSYTWSGPVSQSAIIIGGVPLHVTENLELALRRVRGPIRARNMWVDAICINQNDDEEKCVQVSMMGDIYAGAARTAVWLGEKSADSDVAMDFIHSLRQRASDQSEIFSHDSDEDYNDEDSSDGDDGDEDSGDEKDGDEDDGDEDGSHETEDNSDEDDSDDDDSDEGYIDEDDSDEDDGDNDDSDANQIPLQAITDLMRRKWWTRIWVVQEALKSRRVTVICGAREVDMAYFAQLVKVEAFEDRPEEPRLPVEQSLLDMTLEENPKHPRHPLEQPFVGILSDWYVRKHQVETGGLPLMDLTLLTHNFQASVQKDRLYALLGLATPDARSWIIPDYSDAMSHRLILIRLTAYFLRSSWRPLRFASHCRAAGCPSWVPDWTAIDGRVIWLIQCENSAFRDSLAGKSARSSERLPPSSHATAQFNPRLEPPFEELTRYQEPSALLVHGLIVDRVDIVFQIPNLHDNTESDPKMEVPTVKAKIREWESRMVEYLEMYQSQIGIVHRKPRRPTKATSKSVRKVALQDLKASVIRYLVGRKTVSEQSDPIDFYGQIKMLRKEFDFDGYTTPELIDVYESWMQQPGQDARGTCEENSHGPSGSCAQCSASTTLKRTKKLGRKIVAQNAGRTMFLTRDGYHYVERFAVAEGDVICKVWHSFYHLILRRADDDYWTLVGHFQPDYAPLERTKGVDRSNVEAKTEMFRLK